MNQLKKPIENEFELAWENVACNYCGSSHSAPKFNGPDRLLKFPGEFSIVVCQNCGIHRQNPRPTWDALKHYYPEAYVSYTPHQDEYVSFTQRLERRYGMWKRMRAVQSVQKSGLLLDVGCGTGNFLAEIKHHQGWQAVGVEPSITAANYAANRLPYPIINSSFLDYADDAMEFDVITMWNVLEHLPYPCDELDHAGNLLKDRGWLIGSIPNMEGIDRKIFGRYWLGWDLPRHLYYFQRDQLEKALMAKGFRLYAVRCIASTYAALRHDLEFWMQAWEHNRPVMQRLLLDIYNLPVTKVALIPGLWVLDRLKLSPILTFIAQKNSVPN